jgi:ATP-binding cassette subfamily C protein
VLFVPMLAAIGGGTDVLAATGGHIGHLLGAIGVAKALGPLLIIFVVLALARALFNQARDITQHRLVNDALDALRTRAWTALLHCEWRTLSAMRRSDGTALLITEVERFGGGLNQLLGALAIVLTLGGLTLGALAIAPGTTLVALAIGAVVLLLYVRFGGGARQHGERLGAANRAMHAAFAEGLGALRIIKSFGQEARSVATGEVATQALRGAEHRFLVDLGRGQIALQAGGAACLAAFVWVAVELGHASGLLILPLVALALRTLPLLAVLHHSWQNWTYARPALATTQALIAHAEAAQEPEDAGTPSLRPATREIALMGVTLWYPGQPRATLDAVSLALPVGSITALVGASGGGKSTMADLFGGLLSPEAGALTLDGAALDGVARRTWRRRVAYVQQDAWLATASLRENLRWADPAADEARMVEALRLAAADFVLALPDGLDTSVGDSGRALSGGERQRVVLARALLRRPDLLILDEATSALDPESEAAVARVVEALRGTMTILVIGHRGALTALADRTAVLRDGRIVDAAD